VIVMRKVEGLSMQEIADVLGIGVGAAKVSVFRARQRSRELVGPRVANETAADCTLVTQP
jgi:DNA-directed RNA polymerase specialized sigma24 family protein